MSDERWMRGRRKAANKAGERCVLVAKVLECVLRNLDQHFSVNMERI